jgi:hypothetical protein
LGTYVVSAATQDRSAVRMVNVLLGVSASVDIETQEIGDWWGRS